MATYRLAAAELNPSPVIFSSNPVKVSPKASSTGKLIIQKDRFPTTFTIEVFGRVPGGTWNLLTTITQAEATLSGNNATAEFAIAIYPEVRVDIKNVTGGTDSKFYPYIADGTPPTVENYGLDFPATFNTDTSSTRARIYLPPGPAPADGFPVYINCNNPGFTSSGTTGNGSDANSITDDRYLSFLQEGFAVVDGGMHYASAVFAAADGGTWRDPYQDAARYTNPTFPKAMRCAHMLVMYYRYWGPKRWNLNPNAIILGGRSGGGGVAAEGAFRESLTDPTSTSPVLRTDDRPNGFYGAGFPTYFPAAQSTDGGAWFPNTADNGLAATMAGTTNFYRRNGSAGHWAFSDADRRRRTVLLPQYIQFEDDITSIPFDLAAGQSKWGFLDVALDDVSATHDGWYGELWAYKMHEAALELGYQGLDETFRFNHSGSGTSNYKTSSVDQATSHDDAAKFFASFWSTGMKTNLKPVISAWIITDESE